MSGTLVSLLSEMLDVRMPRNNSLHKVRDATTRPHAFEYLSVNVYRMKRSMPLREKPVICGICGEAFTKDEAPVCVCANQTCEGTEFCHFRCVLYTVRTNIRYDDVTDTSEAAVKQRVDSRGWFCPVCVLAAPPCAIEDCRGLVGDRSCRECDKPLCEKHFFIYFRGSKPLWKDADGNGALMCPACPLYGKTEVCDEEGRPVESAPCK